MPSEKNLQEVYLNEEDTSELEIDFVELMYRLIEKMKWVIFAAVLGMVAAGVFTNFFITPQYEATTKLYVLDSKDQVIDVSALNLADKLASDYVQVFKNWHVHKKVIDDLGLPYSFEQIQDMLHINVPSSTRIIEITVTSPDPQEAYDIAMAYAETAPLFIEAKMETSRPNVFEEALIPTKPSSPHLLMNMAIGLIMGGVLAVAIIFIHFISDDRIRNAEILQKRLGIATLGMMPVQESDDVGAKKRKSGKGAKK